MNKIEFNKSNDLGICQVTKNRITKLGICLFVAIAGCFTLAPISEAEAQNNQWAYFVDRDAEHTSGYSYVQTYGPFRSLAEAQDMMIQLDSNRQEGSYFYSKSRLRTDYLPAWMLRQMRPSDFQRPSFGLFIF